MIKKISIRFKGKKLAVQHIPDDSMQMYKVQDEQENFLYLCRKGDGSWRYVPEHKGDDAEQLGGKIGKLKFGFPGAEER